MRFLRLVGLFVILMFYALVVVAVIFLDAERDLPWEIIGGYVGGGLITLYYALNGLWEEGGN